MIKTTESKHSAISRKRFQKFVFVGGQRERQSLHREVQGDFSANDRLLCDTQVNDYLAIAQIKTDRSTQKYLRQLGLKPGVIIEVISKTAAESIIVRINTQHIGLGIAIAQNVVVRLR